VDFTTLIPPVTSDCSLACKLALKFSFFSSRRRHTRSKRDWSSDVCSSDLLKKALSGFFKAQLILITITAGSIYIGLLIVGIDHALTIALLAAGVDLLPYIGTGIIFIPWIIYLFF